MSKIVILSVLTPRQRKLGHLQAANLEHATQPSVLGRATAE
jgi:hypothetical protein